MAIIPSTLNTGLSSDQVMEAFDNALTHVPGTSEPAMDGTGSAGSADTFSRSDHVHPTDTSRASATAEAEDRAALVELVDSGAKNLLNIEDSNAIDYSATHTAVDNILVISGTSSYARVAYPVTLKKGKYRFIATVDAISEDSRIRFNTASAGSGDSIAPDISITETGNYSASIELSADTSFYVMFFSRITSGSTTSSAQFSQIMLDSLAVDNISSAYQPYRPSYQELYERVVALENA